MNLRDRRAVMVRKIMGFLYPIANGTVTHRFRVTTTDEGHVTMYNSSRQTAGKYINLRDINTYFTTADNENTMNCTKWFTLHAGDSCIFTCDPNPSAIEMRLYIANSVSIYKAITSGTSMSFTVENDTDIGSVGLRTMAAINAETTLNFDISLTVNGKRYF